MKKIGFLSFGHWSPSPHSQTRSAADALLQSIDLAVAAEELGADGAYFRVHHFARQLASPFPLLAAVGARTSRIEIGTGVIDMRYENPLYMAEDAGAADLIAGGRLQLGISRGSPEQVIDGYRYFGSRPGRGRATTRTMARRAHRRVPRGARGRGFRRAQPAPDVPEPARAAADRAALPGAARPDLVGCRRPAPRPSGPREKGMNLMCSTLLHEDTGVPFHQLQAEQIERFRDTWRAAGHQREPRVSVSRSIFPIVDDRDRAYFGRETASDGPGRRPRRRPGALRRSRTPASPSSWSRSSPTTRRSRPPTRCC